MLLTLEASRGATNLQIGLDTRAKKKKKKFIPSLILSRGISSPSSLMGPYSPDPPTNFPRIPSARMTPTACSAPISLSLCLSLSPLSSLTRLQSVKTTSQASHVCRADYSPPAGLFLARTTQRETEVRNEGLKKRSRKPPIHKG